ncbi:hypothetical protein CGMCC3_g2873 [Colletotrichum fructicola]|nr:uncharacterized protein CGMCC3_g2873 [Colletotrichum fructicola]KAE9581416.1 hypothetical protein CGMCC3_g2873 [Colletotrichum fructicola]
MGVEASAVGWAELVETMDGQKRDFAARYLRRPTCRQNPVRTTV